MTEGAATLTCRSIGHLLQDPSQAFGVEADPEIQVAIRYVEDMEKVPTLPYLVVVGEVFYEIVPESPTHLIRNEAVLFLAI